MSLKYVFDPTADINGWFSPYSTDEGWLDQEFSQAGGTTIIGADGASSGLGTANAITAALSAVIANTAGSATASGIGAGVFLASGAAAASAGASGVAASIFAASGAADAISVSEAVAVAVLASVAEVSATNVADWRSDFSIAAEKLTGGGVSRHHRRKRKHGLKEDKERVLSRPFLVREPAIAMPEPIVIMDLDEEQIIHALVIHALHH
jgi:hypothetical protein